DRPLGQEKGQEEQDEEGRPRHDRPLGQEKGQEEQDEEGRPRHDRPLGQEEGQEEQDEEARPRHDRHLSQEKGQEEQDEEGRRDSLSHRSLNQISNGTSALAAKGPDQKSGLFVFLNRQLRVSRQAVALEHMDDALRNIDEWRGSGFGNAEVRYESRAVPPCATATVSRVRFTYQSPIRLATVA